MGAIFIVFIKNIVRKVENSERVELTRKFPLFSLCPYKIVNTTNRTIKHINNNESVTFIVPLSNKLSTKEEARKIAVCCGQ